MSKHKEYVHKLTPLAVEIVIAINCEAVHTVYKCQMKV